MSFIEAPLEASKLFTPNAKQLTAAALGQSASSRAAISSECKSAETRPPHENTEDQLRSAFMTKETAGIVSRYPTSIIDKSQADYKKFKERVPENSMPKKSTPRVEVSLEDDNEFLDHSALSKEAREGALPKALGQIKSIVTAFVQKLGLPICRRASVEEELSRSIS